MEKPLKFFQLLSLEEMALRRLAAIVCNGSDTLPTIMEWVSMPISGIFDKRGTIVQMVVDKIMKLKLPEPLAKRMCGVFITICFEIRIWEGFHSHTFIFRCNKIFEQDSAKLCFTTAGAVDCRRTAHELVRCDKIHVRIRYEMACSYWLEDCIPLLWQELEEVYKEYFYEKTSALGGLESSWPHIFKDGQSNLDSHVRKSDRNLTSFNQWAFEHSAKKGYKATAEHFFRQLTDEERGASLMRSAHAVVSAVSVVQENARAGIWNVLHYLLSLMTAKQQLEMVKAYPVQAMSCFLDWPRQDLLLENAGLIWPFLPPNLYQDLVRTFDGYEGSLFVELFKQSPLDFKKYVVRPDDDGFYFSINFLQKCFHCKDSEAIEVVFRTVDVAARLKFVFHFSVLQLFYDSMVRDDWRLVEVCLREATLSGEDRARLKERFLEDLSNGSFWLNRLDSFLRKIEVPQMNDRDPKLKRFFNFLDGTDASTEEEQKGQKRKLEDSFPE